MGKSAYLRGDIIPEFDPKLVQGTDEKSNARPFTSKSNQIGLGSSTDPFVGKYSLKGWSPRRIIPPVPLPPGFDDVKVERYRKHSLISMEAQGEGVRGPFPLASSYEKHLESALNSAFPLASECPFH